MNDRVKPSRGNRCYDGIEVKISKEEFVAWYVLAYDEFVHSGRGDWPSVDRIDSTGHYSLDNIQLVSFSYNCQKTKKNKQYRAPDGMSWCGKCQRYLPVESFGKCATMASGLHKRCKACSKEADRIRWLEGKTSAQKKRASRKQ